MTRQTRLPQRPAIEDPLQEKEIFVSDIAGVGLVHGNVVVTLTSLRPDVSEVGEPKLRNIVVGRLALTNHAAGQLLQQLQSLSAQIQITPNPAVKTRPN
jgi:hypothetical protein